MSCFPRSGYKCLSIDVLNFMLTKILKFIFLLSVNFCLLGKI